MPEGERVCGRYRSVASFRRRICRRASEEGFPLVCQDPTPDSTRQEYLLIDGGFLLPLLSYCWLSAAASFVRSPSCGRGGPRSSVAVTVSTARVRHRRHPASCHEDTENTGHAHALHACVQSAPVFCSPRPVVTFQGASAAALRTGFRFPYRTLLIPVKSRVTVESSKGATFDATPAPCCQLRPVRLLRSVRQPRPGVSGCCFGVPVATSKSS